MIHFRIMSVGVSDIIELQGQQGPSQGGGQGHVPEGRGADSGSSTEAGQLQSMLPPPPIQPTNVPCVSTITYAPLVAIDKDIGEALEDRTKTSPVLSTGSRNSAQAYLRYTRLSVRDTTHLGQ